jgi:FO synthase
MIGAPVELGPLPAPPARALERALGGDPLTREDAALLIQVSDAGLPGLLAAASSLRDRGRGRRISFSKKVFVPLTTLCRDYCGYCTFRKDPGEPGAHTMTPEEVIALVQAGARLGCKEALFSLGDKPETLFPEHREFLKRHGHRTTLGYLREMCELVLKESPLLPHANPGVMGERDLALLRESNVSMGLMIETTSERLLGAGLAHDRAPDKIPRRRLRTIEWAGKLQIPFTTGILIGIGETPEERVDSLLAIRNLAERYGHIQEVIIQNFRAKPEIPMRHQPEPSSGDMLRTVAVARLLLGPSMNLQAPPNLSPETYPRLIGAGLNDWGGISPLTLDHINPEAPWPRIVELRRATEAAGYEFRERLAIYPDYVPRPEFLAESLRPRVRAYTDNDGYVRQELEQWRHW